MRRLRVARPMVPCVCVALALVAGTSAATAKTYVTKGSFPEKAVYRPKAFVAGSGVGGGVIELKHIHWMTWGLSSATGSGILTYNTCDPFCASGNLKSVHASVKLWAPRQHCKILTRSARFVRSPVPLFTKIAVTYPGAPVWHSIAADTQYCQ